VNKKQVFKIDDDGFYIEPVIVKDDEELGEKLIETPIPEGLFSPRWDGEKWVEGLTSEEIEQLKQQNQPQPSELDLLKQENAELKERIELMQAALDDLILGGI
jgi:hypothetical protein